MFIAWAWAFIITGISLSLSGIVFLHETHPLLWIINFSPVVFAIFAGVAGFKQVRIELLNQNLETQILERTQNLIYANQQLAEEINTRKEAQVQLQKLNHEAQEEIKARTDFLATMSHEVRTPLNAMIGTAGLLAETPVNSEQLDYLNTIRVSGEIMLGVINNILDYSKLDTESFSLEEMDFFLREPVEDVLDILYPKGMEKGVEIYSRFEPGLPDALRGDMARLRQILTNLVSNAVKFTEKGEVVVWVRPLRVDEHEAEVMFEVRDTGIGIPKASIGHIFEAYKQAEGSTNRRFGGTGLGLAISQRLVGQMKGKIWVESEYHKGSSFFFTVVLPIGDPTPPTNATATLLGKRVLLVDDFLPNLQLLGEDCRRLGLEPTLMTSPERALEALNHMKYDLVVTDLRMPTMDGLTFTREIKRKSPQLPVILISALGFRIPAGERTLFEAVLNRPVRHTFFTNTLMGIFTKVRRVEPKADSFSAVPFLKDESPLAILVAEDNLINQRVASRMFEKMGYKIDIASDGKQALVAATTKKYDLIFMDMQMPEMNGIEATTHILASEKAGTPIIIAMTANASTGDKSRCLEAGMRDFITKPVQLEGLRKTLDTWKINISNGISQTV